MKKVTKRQRELMNGPNTATLISLNQSKVNGEYFGANPVFVNRAPPHEVADFLKIQAGIPFVRPSNFGL